LLKVEGHATNGFNVEQVMNVLGPVLKGSYFIVSLSTSF
jgi:hypothetical protein